MSIEPTKQNYVVDGADVNPNYAAALQYLPQRGITEATTKAACVRVEQCYDPKQAELWLGSTTYTPEAGVIFPNLDIATDGSVIETSYSTRCFPTGTPKFRNTAGSEVRPYILPESRRQARKVEVAVFVTEGPARALLLAQNGYCAISSGNCWGPNGKQDEGDNAVVRIHADLKDWSWLGRSVFLAPDADYSKNESVLQGLIRQIVVFAALGATVKVVTWDAGTGKGLDDFVAGKAGLDVAKQTEVLNALVDGATDAVKFLDPNWLDLFVREFSKADMTDERRSQLAKRFAKRFDIPTESLRRCGDDASTGQALIEDVEPWPEPVDGVALLDGICACVRKYVSMSEREAVTVALWALNTYVYDSFDILPILGVTAPDKRCGKTTLLKVLNQLTKRPLFCSSLTSAVVYRIIEKWQPTLLVDEADSYLPRNEELRGIINSGHDRAGAWVPRSNKETLEPERFSTWCPKAIAQIGRLPATIEDRCFPIQLKRKDKAESVTKLRRCHYPAITELARKCQRWADDNGQALRGVEVSLTNDRLEDNWEPLFGIATLVGGGWYERAIDAALGLGANLTDESFQARLLAELQRFTIEHPETVVITAAFPIFPTDDILKVLNANKETPWASLKNGLTPHKLAKTLRTYGVEPQQQRRAPEPKDKTKAKVRGYYQPDLTALFDRWITPTVTPPDLSGTSGAIGISGARTTKTDVYPASDPACTDSASPERDGADQVSEPVPESRPACTDCPALKETVDGRIPPYRYVVTAADLAAAVADIDGGAGSVALDIETYFPDARLTKAGKRMKVAVDTVCDRYKPKIRLLQLYAADSETVWLLDIRALEKAGASFDALRDTVAIHEAIGHNITAFDLPWLWHHLQVRVPAIRDTLTAHHLLYGGTDEPGDLGGVVKRMLGVELSKDQGASDFGVDTLSAEQLAYAANDVFHLHALLQAQCEALSAAKLDTAWSLEKRLAPVVVDMTNRGFVFNVSGLAGAKAELENRLATARDKALVWLGAPSINLNSWQQLLPAFAAKGVTLASTSEDDLRKDGSEGSLLLLDYRGIVKELAFVAGLTDATASDGRIHATFQSTGTRTGRFSSKDPNLQNIPRSSDERFSLRSLFQAPASRKLVIADFSQMELVAASALAPEPKMLAAIAAGDDLHLRTASILLGRQATKADRSLAKAVNFGLLYGQSAKGLREYAKNTYGVTMTEDEAKEFRTTFFREYDGLAAWHAQAWRDAENASVTEIRTRGIKRRRQLPDIGKKWQRFASLVNTVVQGSCAEVQKLSMLAIAERLGDKALLVNCVHDELVVEVATADAECVLSEVVAIMQQAFAKVCKGAAVNVEANIADNWAQKGGKPMALAA